MRATRARRLNDRLRWLWRYPANATTDAERCALLCWGKAEELSLRSSTTARVAAARAQLRRHARKLVDNRPVTP